MKNILPKKNKKYISGQFMHTKLAISFNYFFKVRSLKSETLCCQRNLIQKFILNPLAQLSKSFTHFLTIFGK